jgi:PKD repeat protein
VVVHVIWKTSQQNIPDAQIISQIEVLNEDYRRLNADTTNTPVMFQGVAADVEIEFCLATTDPDGNPTDGITRTETTVNSFTQNNAMKYTSQGGHDAWPSDHYLNIWVCNLGGGLLGYAQFPNGPATTDGVVIGYQFFGYNSPGGYPYHLGRTTTHEVGHWLNLYHIWGDDGGACTGTDLVADTPNQGGEYYGCPPFPQSSCGSEDMFQNYMDYSDDGCMNIFTAGQKTRVHAAINVFRTELFESMGCVSDLPTAAFTANHTHIPVDCEVNFTDLSAGDPIAWNWYFEGGSPSSSTEQNPSGIVYQQSGSFLVSLEVENGSGPNTIEIDNYISVGPQYLPVVDFVADQESFCTQGTVTLTDLSTACPFEWEWTFDPPTVTFVNGTTSASQHPQVTFDVSGNYSVTLKATNANGDATMTWEDYLYAGGRPLPFTENFEMDSETLNGWTILNPDGETTWEHIEAEGNEPGMYSMSIYFHEMFSVYERDQLISPVLDLTGVNYAALGFRHAYAQYQASLSDSLNIYVSNDCGATWSKVFGIAEEGSGNFATAPPSAEQFFPESADDWCGSGTNAECLVVDLSPWAGSSDFQIMFESYDLYGNTLYLDDVELIITTSTSNPSIAGEVAIDLYPVPAEDYLYLDIRNVRDYVDVQVLNIQGTLLYSQRMVAEQSAVKSGLSLSQLGSGIYFIRLSNADFSQTEKIILK